MRPVDPLWPTNPRDRSALERYASPVVLMHVIDDESTQTEASLLLRIEDGPWVFAGRYEIRALLGVGGMGSVYKALDRELDDLIALKVIRNELLVLPGVVERFRREVKLARKVTHRNVARVYDLGESEGERYFTMEYIDGLSLGTALSDGPLPLSHALRVGKNLSEGLAAAHAAGVIHRDLKPDNIILGTDDRAVITDFGIARSLGGPIGTVTLEGTWIGTPVYMAPELIAGDAVADEACDVFALGAVLFEAVTRELPWRGDTSIAIAIARLQLEPIDPRELRPGLPDGFAEVILRCLSRDRAERFSTAQAVGRALASVVLPTVLPRAIEPVPLVSSRATSDTLPGWSLERIPAALASATSGATKTVAVLPFRELGGSGDPYFADVLTEAVIDALSATRLLRVRPLGMSMRHRDSADSALEIGRRLQAQVIVEGTVEARDDKLTVLVRVTSVANRFRLWSGAFELEGFDVYAIGDEIGVAVAQSLAADPSSPATKRALGPRARDLYSRARRGYHGFWQEGAQKVVPLFERAMGLAPDDPGVLAGYALACLRESSMTGIGADRAIGAAERARELAPDLPEVRLAWATIKLDEGDPAGAVGELKHALQSSPTLGEAHALLGRILLEADVVEIGKQRLEWALAIEPNLTVARHDLARACALLGRWDEVESVAASAPPGGAGGAWLDRGRFSVWRRDSDVAAVYLDELSHQYARKDMPSHVPLDLARLLLELAAHGRSPFDDRAFAAFVGAGATRSRRSVFRSQIEAEVFAALGRNAEALAAVGRATEAGLIDLAWLDRCPLLAPLRETEAFERARVAVGSVASSVREAVFDD